MNPLREYLDILFRRIQPETLLANLEARWAEKEKYALELDCCHVSASTFRHYAHLNLQDFSTDEVENFYDEMQNYLRDHTSKRKKSIFYLIPEYMQDVVVLRDGIPYCRYMETLNWHDISFKLGQDLLLCSYLAYEDLQNRKHRHIFNWNSIIKTDNKRLHNILEKGIAENHFHLYGSTQVFALSWGCLMNHPRKISEFLKKDNAGIRMTENLNGNLSLGVLDNQLEWKKRLYIACWIRKELFSLLRSKNTYSGKNILESLIGFWGFYNVASLAEDIESLREAYGCKFRQMRGSGKCLDYAIRKGYAGNNENDHNRFLVGERLFLYECFYACYDGKFNQNEQDAFYLYLLIKSQFRNELIQVNQRVGFSNFSAYQDRKADFWWNVREYQYEAYRLAIEASMKDEHIVDFETRITPAMSYQDNIKRVMEIDGYFSFIENGKHEKIADIKKYGISQDYFFVIHFLKRKQKKYVSKDDIFFMKPRNWEVRQRTEQCARALKKALAQNQYYAQRVWGIDACSIEIGCRPETFATEFRYLRNITGENNDVDFMKTAVQDRTIWISYHVGEDFLDIADGLRAIDEAIFFLELDREDRLGHALALGVDPKLHYELKRKMVLMPKQDLLDNYVWLLFRSLELGVDIPQELRSNMECKAEQLLYEIYIENTNTECTLNEYYQSWKLRGDDPRLYQTGNYVIEDCFIIDHYHKARICRNKELNVLRSKSKICKLYSQYHYGQGNIRERGQEIEKVKITDSYMKLMYDMQERMQKLVVDKGIAIESNPSSNVLIGTFKRYENHPMLRFNNYSLNSEYCDSKTDETIQINVSINTDDQGVFDTSLENEYALMACALEKKRDAEGNKVYSQDAIYHYLEHVRQMGVGQVFRKRK